MALSEQAFAALTKQEFSEQAFALTKQFFKKVNETIFLETKRRI